VYVIFDVLDILKHSSFESVFHFREWKKVGWYEVRQIQWVAGHHAMINQEACHCYGRTGRVIVV
jgi:hypothetical protein